MAKTNKFLTMSFLSFLSSATVEEAVVPAKGSNGGPRKQVNPNPAILAIRVWKDGSVYPSQAAVDKFQLEYGKGTYETIPAVAAVGVEGQEGYKAAKPATRKFVPNENAIGNGFDVIDSQNWAQFKAEGRLLFLGLVPKSLPKVDLFGTTRFDAEGNPLLSVLNQGSTTFGQAVLLEAIEEIYGIKFQRNAKDATEDNKAIEAQEGVEFVDMLIAEELEGVNITEAFSKPISFFPKKVTRGADKGKDDYERRENIKVYGFVPLALTQDLSPVENLAETLTQEA